MTELSDQESSWGTSSDFAPLFVALVSFLEMVQEMLRGQPRLDQEAPGIPKVSEEQELN